VAAQAGCHIVDGAVSSMAGLTSQPSINALVAAMGGGPKCPEVSLPVLDELARYWEGVRTMYQDFDPGWNE
jgi:pyruvate carboxylase